MLKPMKSQPTVRRLRPGRMPRVRAARLFGAAAALLFSASIAQAQPAPAPYSNPDLSADAPAGAPSPSAAVSGPSNAGPLPPLPTSAPQEAAGSSEPADPAAYDLATDTDPSALTAFREPLAPYGTWEEDATYGVVWTPYASVVGADFTPYVSHGHWGLTAGNSWLWQSDFNWGWAPFHYGRWVWIGGRGWAWIPGRVYAPAWVVWRTGLYDDYYVGWAPMPPTWYWRSGFAYSLWRVPPAPYVFCSASYVFSPRVRSYIAPAGRVAMIAPRTRPYLAAGVQSTAASAYRTAAFTRGPNPAEAHVPVTAVPSTRSTPDPRALALSRPVPSAGSSTGQGLRPYPAPAGAGLQNRGALAGGAPGNFASGYGRPMAPYVARPVVPGSPALPGAAPALRPYAGPQVLPQAPSVRPSYPTEIPRPAPGGPMGSGGALRPMAPSWGGAGSGGALRPTVPSGGGGGLRPMAPPSFGGGGSMRPMAPGGGGFGRPRVR